MRKTQFAITLVLLSAIIAQPSVAHEPKEYTILLTEQGMTPSTVPDDVLVETDYLFFMDVDDREGVSHRIQLDADGDGLFDGPDDISTAWLTGSCELDGNGSKVDSDCMVAEAVLLGPQNGILPGNVSMRHQTMANSTISDNYLTVVLGEDVHVQIMPEVNQPVQMQELTEKGQNDILVVVLFLSLMGVMAILPLLYPPKDQ
ncbi:MAG: hypothetical protein QGI73_03925 [Candidatus Thalassarchaeaceae archaeon]|nr:hypothetical protein [Candidatus Thalassarchaeaceae archaeon]